MHGKRSIWARFGDLISGPPEPVGVPVEAPVRVTGRGVRLPLDGHTVEITMGGRRLHLTPDLTVTGGQQGHVRELMVFYPDRYYGRIGHFARLLPGVTLNIDLSADAAERNITSPVDAMRSSVRLRHEGDSLELKSTTEPECFVATLVEGPTGNRILADRQRALERIGEVYGGYDALAPEAALALLGRVNRVMEREPYRTEASDGRVGGIVELPVDKTPIVVGDLHGRVENLLTLLSRNAFLESLEKGEAALVILGDAVHQEEPDSLEDMESSVLVMDLIFRLKLAYPSGVFFLLGNHDSFSVELMKHGVPQGMVWDRYLTRLRGDEYRDEMQRFYSLCPLLVVSDDFVACHAGVPRMGFTRQKLVDVRQHPSLLHELTWNRQSTRGNVGGYTGADVRRMFRVLGMPDDSTLVVGHYPRSQTGSVWLNAGGVARHHVVISSRQDEVAVLTRVDGEFVAQIYAPERLIAWLNRKAGERRDLGTAPDTPPPAGPRQALQDQC